MIRLVALSLFFHVLLGCDFKAEKKISVNSKNEFSISKRFFEDRKIFPNLSGRDKKQKRKIIQEYFNKTLGSQQFSGSFLVAQNGQIIFEKYQGFSNYETGKKINSRTAIHLASVGKVLTATAIMRLVQIKILKLDQLVQFILPKFPYDAVTVRMLLNHRSGVPKYANFSSIDSVWNTQNTLTNQAILDLLSKHKFPLDFKPDTKFTYNNSNYALLALIIEKLTAKSFSVAMRDLVFDPIGMRNTFVMRLKKDSAYISQSYKSNYSKIPFDFLDAIYGDKNIYSTPHDLILFDMAFYNNKFISEDLKKEIYKGYSYEKYGIKNYGLGIRLKEWETGQKIFYHNGWWHGNNSCYVTLKKEKVTIIVLSNIYSRKVYDAIRLSSIFGDYPFELEMNSADERGIEILFKKHVN